jgi:hypothetical protein
VTKEIITNRFEEIELLINSADSVWMAVSYVKRSGVRLLSPHFQRIGKVKILCDTHQRITDKEALRELLSLDIELKTYVGCNNFHPKVWLFRSEGVWSALVGSLNISEGALIDNIEAGVLLTEIEYTTPFVEWFDNIWNGGQQIDEQYIEAMPEANNFRVNRRHGIIIEDIAPQHPIFMPDANSINNFIFEWTHDTLESGQWNRKTGWTFRPAKGLIQNTINQLQSIIQYMFLDDTDSIYHLEVNDEATARAIYNHAGIQLSRTRTGYYGNLIRGPLDYLERLGFIERINPRRWNQIIITPRGITFMLAPHTRLIDIAAVSISGFRWFGIPLASFTEHVLTILPENKITFIEALLFLFHGGVDNYSATTPEDIADMILSFREFSDIEKQNTLNYAITCMSSFSGHSHWDNMKNNWVKDMFYDLAIINCFEIINESRQHLFMEISQDNQELSLQLRH